MRVSVLVAVATLALPAIAEAYPQFQLSTGTDTCSQCHFSPGGGGLINEYGRDEASSLSMFEVGDGRFAHGAWSPPDSFQIGADLRGVGGARLNYPADVTEPLVFPMQLEVYLRPRIGPVSLYVAGGIRPARSGLAPASREHFLTYQPDDATWYVRAGRFFPVFGLRTQDHTAYVRRHLQMYIYEEPYGAAWGKFGGDYEVHLSAFVRSPPDLGTAQDSGVAAYYEARNEDATAAYALQTRLTISETDRRGWIGGIYKRWLEGSKVMLMGELDVGVQAFPGAEGMVEDPTPRLQLVGYAGAWYMATQGLMLGAAIQGYDPDLQLEVDSRQAAELNLQWFAIPHLELHLLGRYEVVGDAFGTPVVLFLSQLHYYL